ncbi:hypothetical protein AX17_004151 [Amanita inopinata Kibby_2008]|nr:hypothetical protein AX17_004151 [Amanita inopinata Kibby_2008]
MHRNLVEGTNLSFMHRFAKRIKLVASVFGFSDTPTSGADPVATANSFAAWVKQYNLDGIDVDYEDFNAFDKGDGSAESWLITFTQTLRAQLPQGQYILTHARFLQTSGVVALTSECTPPLAI